MVARREEAHDAAYLRLAQAQRKLQIAERSGWADYLLVAARQEVETATADFGSAQRALKDARSRHAEQT